MQQAASDADAGRGDQRRRQQQPQTVLANTGALRMEQLRPPDHLRRPGHKLRAYLDDEQATLQPAAGDQVVYRLARADGGQTSSGDAAGGAPPAGQMGAPQAAVLGSPKMPLGVSSALGYLHLGQLARVKVPPHLLETGVHEDDGATTRDVNDGLAAGNGGSMPAAAAARPAPQEQQQQRVPARAAAAQQRQEATAANDDSSRSSGTSFSSSSSSRSSSSADGGGGAGALQQQRQQPQQPLSPVLTVKHTDPSGLTIVRPADYSLRARPHQHGQQQLSPGRGPGRLQQRGDAATSPRPQLHGQRGAQAPHAAGGDARYSTAVRVPSPAAAAAAAAEPAVDPAARAAAAATARRVAVDLVQQHRSSKQSAAPKVAAAGAGAAPAAASAAALPCTLSDGSSWLSRSSSSAGADTEQELAAQELPATPAPSLAAMQSPFKRAQAAASSPPQRAVAGGLATPHPSPAALHAGRGTAGASGGSAAAPQQQRPPPPAAARQLVPAAAAAVQQCLQAAFGAGSAGAAAGAGPGPWPAAPGEGSAQAAAAADDVDPNSGFYTPPDACSVYHSAISTPRSTLSHASSGTSGVPEFSSSDHSGSSGGAPGAAAVPAAAAAGRVSSAVPGTLVRTPGAGAAAAALPPGAAVSGAGARLPRSPRDQTRSPEWVLAAAAQKLQQQQAACCKVAPADDDVLGSSGPPSATVALRGGDVPPPPPSTAGGSTHSRSAGQLHLRPTSSTAATAGSSVPGAGGADSTVTSGDGGDDRGGDDRVQYDVELLAVIPGRGRLSGKPLLSEAAQQLAHDRQLDLRALTAGTEPRLRPPKPQRGLGGWLRRHLSVNTGAPWRAGKKGLGVLGLRSCFGGGKKQGAPQQGGGGGNGGAAQKQQ